MRDTAASKTSALVLIFRLTTALVVASVLVASVVGGLLRAGVAVPVPGDSVWPGQAVLEHAFLMICAFLGTVIGIERAVAVKRRFAFAAPASSATAGLLMLAGVPAAAWLTVLAAMALIAVNVTVMSRQKAAHTVLLLTGAAVWLVGNLLYARGARGSIVVPWWFSFLVPKTYGAAAPRGPRRQGLLLSCPSGRSGARRCAVDGAPAHDGRSARIRRVVVGFGLFAVRYWPVLTRSRLDGKPG